MSDQFLQNPRTAGRVIDGQAFVVTSDDNRIYTLNETGSLVWSLAEAGCTEDEVTLAITQRYEVPPEAARADARRFLDDLVARSVLVRE